MDDVKSEVVIMMSILDVIKSFGAVRKSLDRAQLQYAYNDFFAEIKKPLFKGLFVAYKRALCTVLVTEVIYPKCLF